MIASTRMLSFYKTSNDVDSNLTNQILHGVIFNQSNNRFISFISLLVERLIIVDSRCKIWSFFKACKESSLEDWALVRFICNFLFDIVNPVLKMVLELKVETKCTTNTSARKIYLLILSSIFCAIFH